MTRTESDNPPPEPVLEADTLLAAEDTADREKPVEDADGKSVVDEAEPDMASKTDAETAVEATVQPQAAPEETPEDAPEESEQEEQLAEEEAAATAEPSPDTHADQLRLVEALLFAASAPLDLPSLRERLPADADVGGLLMELEALYRPRGVNVIQVAGGWTVRTAPDLAPRLNLERKVSRKMSRAAVETLAIVAYHQPVTRAEIEDIRGVVISKGTLDTLMETGWIEPKGRKQTVGRPVTYCTTDAFLQHFSLNDLRDLPGVDELRAAGLIGPRPVTTLGETGELAPADRAAVEAEAEDADTAETVSAEAEPEETAAEEPVEDESEATEAEPESGEGEQAALDKGGAER